MWSQAGSQFADIEWFVTVTVAVAVMMLLSSDYTFPHMGQQISNYIVWL